jgi:hypothetical protein
MANRYAIATGNWSNPAIWDGGVALPAPGDTVRPNGFTVTIDQDLTGTTYVLASNASAPAATGGHFVVSTIPGGGRTINVTGGALVGGTPGYLLLVSAPTGTLTINGAIAGPSGVSMSAGVVNKTGACDLVVVGNVGSTNSSQGHAIRVIGGGTVTVTGDVTGGNAGGGSCSGINAVSLPTTITVTGNVTGGGGTTSPGINLTVGTTGSTVTVNGNVTGGSAASSHGITQAATSDITVNGNVNGGTVSSTAYGMSLGGAGTVIINGNVNGGTVNAGLLLAGLSTEVTINGDVGPTTGTIAPIITSGAVTGSLTINGTITASTSGVAGYAGASASTLVRPLGPVIDSSTGYAAIVAEFMVWPALPDKSTMTIRGDAGFPTVGSAIVLSNFEDNGLPDPADVRTGVLYGPDDTLEGTRHPALTAQAVWDALVAGLDTPGSIGARLRDAATVASTGAQIAAALDAP